MTSSRRKKINPDSSSKRVAPTDVTNLRLKLTLVIIACFTLLQHIKCYNSISIISDGRDSSIHSIEPLALVGTSTGEKPKLIPLVVADSGYSENSSVNILCTVSQGHHESLSFDWFKDGQLISLGSSTKPLNNFDNSITSSSSGSSLPNPARSGSDNLLNDEENSYSPHTNSKSLGLLGPQIEKNPDHTLLRISRVQVQHSGRYTCSAKNQFGQDSSSVNLRVNGKYILSNDYLRPRGFND